MQRVWCFSIASYSSGYHPVQGLFFVRILMSLFRMTDWSQVCNRTFFSFLRQLSGNAIVQHKSRYARDSDTSAPSCFVWRDTTISILPGVSMDFLSCLLFITKALCVVRSGDLLLSLNKPLLDMWLRTFLAAHDRIFRRRGSSLVFA